jgi:hypothetical protein
MPTILCQHHSRHKEETTALSIFPSTKICRKKSHHTPISVALSLGQRSFCISRMGVHICLSPLMTSCNRTRPRVTNGSIVGVLIE